MFPLSIGNRPSLRRAGACILGGVALALVAISPAAAEGTGTIAISAYVCATQDAAQDPGNCDKAGGIGDVILVSEDESVVLTAVDAVAHGGTAVWGESTSVVQGLYFIDFTGIQVPAGYQFWTAYAIMGDTGGSELGWYANLTPDQPNAQLDVVLTPIQTDSDGDGASDASETDFGSDPFDPSSFPVGQAGPVPYYDTDADGDGLTDFEEVEVYGTDPDAADTDGDGVTDRDEVAFGSNPFDPSKFTPVQAGLEPGEATDGDADGDTLTDAEEVDIYATDPYDPDTDGDGASDYDEVWAGNDPLDSGTSAPGNAASAPAAFPSPAPSASGKAAVTQLPNTGAGSGGADGSFASIIAATLGAAALAIFGAVANRRRA